MADCVLGHGACCLHESNNLKDLLTMQNSISQDSAEAMGKNPFKAREGSSRTFFLFCIYKVREEIK